MLLLDLVGSTNRIAESSGNLPTTSKVTGSVGLFQTRSLVEPDQSYWFVS